MEEQAVVPSVGSWRFDTEEERWRELKGGELHHEGTTIERRKLKIVTFNVLFDTWQGKSYKKSIVRSPLRYAWQFRAFEEMDADFICLNEVTPSFVQMLKREEWAKRYYVSDVSEEGVTRKPFGNLLLSKYPIERCHAFTMSDTSRCAIAAVVTIPLPENVSSRICVCSTHFSALTAYHERRKIQLRELCDQLEDALRDLNCDTVLILGDFNFHNAEEDSSIPSDYRDVWKILREDEGYTFDALLNPMIPELWPLGYESRRMRLDRVIQRVEHETRELNWRPVSIDIFANQPVLEGTREDSQLNARKRKVENEEKKGKEKERENDDEEKPLVAHAPLQVEKKRRTRMPWQAGFFAFWWYTLIALLKVLFELGGVNILRNRRKYLYPSDHFGLVVEIEASLSSTSRL